MDGISEDDESSMGSSHPIFDQDQDDDASGPQYLPIMAQGTHAKRDSWQGMSRVPL